MQMPLIIVAGPTAVGKSSTAIRLAKRIGGEIISADSMQVYKGMDIGSAKIMPDEMEGVPHHLIDELEPDEPFNVVVFQKKARHYMEEICSRGNIPILAGGTGFYIQALLYDIDFTETAQDNQIREELERLAAEKGNLWLHQMLTEIDPEAGEMIHANNQKRVIRALEFYRQTGKKISEHNAEEKQKTSPYAYRYFVLNDEREKLYQSIDRRVDLMLEQGLLKEVQGLKARGFNSHMVSMQGLGYKEILEYLEGGCTLEEAVYRLKRDTRRFAKRQLTWFRREPEVIWINKPDYRNDERKILDAICGHLKGII